MKLSPEERRHRWQQFREMPVSKKAEHIWMYYKIPLILLACFVYLLASMRLHKKVLWYIWPI